MKHEMQITNRECTKYANMNLLLYSWTSIYRGVHNTAGKGKGGRKEREALNELHDTGREETFTDHAGMKNTMQDRQLNWAMKAVPERYKKSHIISIANVPRSRSLPVSFLLEFV